jgi:hypothetical protein
MKKAIENILNGFSFETINFYSYLFHQTLVNKGSETVVAFGFKILSEFG